MPRPTDALGAVVYDAVMAALTDHAATPRPPERVRLAEVASHGAPSRRWVEDQARAGRIVLRGPRGARYVMSTDLAALLESTTITRRAKLSESEAETTIEEDAQRAVEELARRRARPRRRQS